MADTPAIACPGFQDEESSVGGASSDISSDSGNEDIDNGELAGMDEGQAV